VDPTALVNGINKESDDSDKSEKSDADVADEPSVSFIKNAERQLSLSRTQTKRKSLAVRL
jgi:hypothetical protein